MILATGRKNGGCVPKKTQDFQPMKLTISVRQAGVPAQRTMTLEDDRLSDRQASGDRNVKF